MFPVCSGLMACGGYEAVSFGQNGYDLDCFYDHASGELVGAYEFNDGPPGCRVAGVGYNECARGIWSSCAVDGGT